jgi:hypothetical protein
MIIGFLVVIPWLATGYIPSVSKNGHSEIANYFLFPLVGVLISVTYVAYVAKRETARHYSSHGESPRDTQASLNMDSTGTRTEKKRSQKEKLYEVMHTEHLREAFERFMVQEFCVENVSFIIAVENFEKEAVKPQDTNSQKQLKILAEDVYARLCNVDSKLCVNISF